MNPVNLSPHFTLDEMVHSQIAERNGINNEPSSDIIKNLERLCDTLEIIRACTGPLIVSSGYRCQKLNEIIGGSSSSQHCKGLAADILSPKMSTLELAQTIRSLGIFDQLIHEGRWVHVSIPEAGKAPRKEVLTARFIAGGPPKYLRGLV